MDSTLQGESLGKAQSYMQRHHLAGWLIYDYQRSNPIFWHLIGASDMVTRPHFFFIPADGKPSLLAHHVDAGKFHQANVDLRVYRNREEMLTLLRSILPQSGPVAMEYSPMATLPRASKVDAGTLELVRGLGIEVVSSADMLQHATQLWSPSQLRSHQQAAEKLGRIVQEAFKYVGNNLTTGVTEYQVGQFIRKRFQEEGLTSPDGPVVAVNQNSSDPHYEPPTEGSNIVNEGDWLLIDLWAKEDTTDAIYADITWVGFIGDKVPSKYQKVFEVVREARDRALHYLEDMSRQGASVQGWQVDKAAREYIASQGYGDFFTHRLGHSIGQQVHGEAVNLDSFETHDTRTITPGIGFSVEPGIYLPEFGVRSEIDVYMSETGPYPTTPLQREVVLVRPRHCDALELLP